MHIAYARLWDPPSGSAGLPSLWFPSGGAMGRSLASTAPEPSPCMTHLSKTALKRSSGLGRVQIAMPDAGAVPMRGDQSAAPSRHSGHFVDAVATPRCSAEVSSPANGHKAKACATADCSHLSL